MAKNRKPSSIGRVFKLIGWLIVLGILAFVGLFGHLLYKEYTLPQPGTYQAIVVLGAQVEPDGKPSVQLTWRLDKALEYYQAQPMPIVVTGAKGLDEPATEASVMAAWLISRGVHPEHVLMDESSFNTKENIKNAIQLLNRATNDILVVTSNYHLPRAMQIARDMGLNPSGVGSPIKPQYWIKNHFRETLAWGKYLLQRFIPFLDRF
ncbi:MAG: YdcF family protein [Clostridiales bacterium]|nr:YdcF family protein [Clostridiales bacterium]